MPTLAEIFNAIAARGGFRGTPISDLDVSEIDPEDLKAAFGNPNIQAQGARARALASQRDVNTLKDPQTYAFTAGMLGERPDQMGFSVLHPDYEKIIGRGEQGLVTGGVSMIGPTAQAIKGLVGAGGRGAMALGQAGARYADRVVPEILDRGGLPAEILQGMGQNTRSYMQTGENPISGAVTQITREDLAAKMQDLIKQKQGLTGAELASVNQQIGGLQAQFKQMPPVQRVAKEVVSPEITAPVSDIGFYSATEQAGQGLARQSGTGESFLNDLMKAPDVKKDELSWMGLDDYLKGKPNVTKQEVQDFIAANKVDVQERQLGATVTEDPIGIAKRKEVFDKYEPQIQAMYKEMDNPRYRLVNRGMGAERYNRGVVLQNRGFRGEPLTVQEQSELDDILRRLDGNTVKEFANAEEARKVYLGMSQEEKLMHSIRPVKSPTELQQELNTIQRTRDIEANNAYVVPEPTPTKYQKYQLPGGENYREILLTMPEKAPKTLPEGYSLQPMANGNFTLVSPDNIGTIIYASSKDDAMAEAIRRFTRKEEPYQSSHFNEPNILAHMRVNDRVDADGKKMLLVEEIQSDWHQAGREKGYNKKLTQAESDELRNLQKKEQDEDGLFQDDIQRINELEKRSMGGVPDAPFKDTWHQLALKRALKYAADNGYERVGLTTGKQQAKRYDLGNEVNSIDVESVEGVPNLQLVDIDVIGGQKIALEVENGVVREGEFAGKRLSDVVGKEMADKITNVAQGKTKSLAGEDLRLGGEGMKTYYDEIYPAFLDKQSKKWNSKTGETRIKTETSAPAYVDYIVGKGNFNDVTVLGVRADGSTVIINQNANSLQEAQQLANRYKEKHLGGGKESIRYIDITPEMKGGLAKGQPLHGLIAAPAVGLSEENRNKLKDMIK
jgi:hypothetical protein